MQGDRNEKQKDAQGSAEFENSYRVRQLGYRVWRVGCGPVKKILATQLHTSQSMILWSTIQQILYQEILLQTNSKNLYLNIRNTMLLHFVGGIQCSFTTKKFSLYSSPTSPIEHSGSPGSGSATALRRELEMTKMGLDHLID